MYGQVFPVRVKATTPWAGSVDESGTKLHGITLTCHATVTDPAFFVDLGYTHNGRYVNEILRGELPLRPPYDIAFVPQKAQLDITEPEPCAVSNVLCELVEFTTTPWLDESHFEVIFKLKCIDPNDSVMGKLAKLKGELAYVSLNLVTADMFLPTVDINVGKNAEDLRVQRKRRRKIKYDNVGKND